MSRRLIRATYGTLLAAGLALPGMVAIGPGAVAADIPGLDARIKTKGADLLYFDLVDPTPNWIKMAVYDDRKDGYGVRGYAYADGATFTVYTNRGKGTHQTREYNAPEGPIKIKLCYTKKGKNVQCTATKKARG